MTRCLEEEGRCHTIMWWMQEVTSSTGRTLAELKAKALDRTICKKITHAIIRDRSSPYGHRGMNSLRHEFLQ